MKANVNDINIESMKRVYFNENMLNKQQCENVRHLEDAMDTFKIFNPYTRIAILSVVGKECYFIIKSETSYNNTPNDRIRMIFGARFQNYNDAQLTVIKSDDVKFFDTVYGGMYGNEKNQGYKYRGRGFNQLTFKSNYDTIGKLIGIDLVDNPDIILTDPTIAAQVCVAYFVNRFKSRPQGHKDLNEFATIDEATLGIFRANAGWNKNIDTTFHSVTLTKVRDWSKNFTYIN